MFDDFGPEQRFQRLWKAVRIERPVHFSLFTFGDSDLPYFLVTPATHDDDTVAIRRGQVTITRPKIITPDSMRPEFRDFFEDNDDFGFVEFLMTRTAAFSNLKLSNRHGPDKIVTDTLDEAVERLNQQLDAEEEEHTAILSAPSGMAGFALLKYAAERVRMSAPGNVQELRERGFLP
ncbi:MAG: hypothetical protein R3C19_07540 [Planctomycetaceae bacterium]